MNTTMEKTRGVRIVLAEGFATMWFNETGWQRMAELFSDKARELDLSIMAEEDAQMQIEMMCLSEALLFFANNMMGKEI